MPPHAESLYNANARSSFLENNTRQRQDESYFFPTCAHCDEKKVTLEMEKASGNSPNETRQLIQPYRLNDLTWLEMHWIESTAFVQKR